MNLLDHLALARFQVVRMTAELKRHPEADNSHQAKVELKLSPAVAPEPGNFQVGMQIACKVMIPGIESSPAEEIFSIDLTINALYRHFAGEVPTAELLSRHHASLGRQLYPLVHREMRDIFNRFGLYEVQLPHEIIHQTGTGNPAPPSPPDDVTRH